MNARTVILEQIRTIAQQHRKTLSPLTDKLPLLESGLDSLCIAILVANLEDGLGLDPFGSGDAISIPVTLGEFIGLYEQAVAE
jgi:hypothetical protein